MRTVIEFEDNGQDFLRWTVENGVVIACEPFQSDIWVGTKILDKPIVVGQKPKVEHRVTGKSRLKYKVKRISEDADVVECVECGSETADPGVGVRCEVETDNGDVCGGRLERKI